MTRLVLGKVVRLADGARGKLADVVIDGSGTRVTHLVVEPDHAPEGARLVPMELVAGVAVGRDDVTLRCGGDLFERLDLVRASASLAPGELPHGDAKWDVGVEDIHATSDLSPSAFGQYGGDSGVFVTYDRVPRGDIELRHASSVYSSDRHHLGAVEAVVVDDSDVVTHLLLDRGHLWWRREIAVPTAAVSEWRTDVVTLGVTKRELESSSAARR